MPTIAPHTDRTANLAALDERLGRAIERLEARSGRFSGLRLGVFIAGGLVTWAAFVGTAYGAGVFVAVVAVFVWLARRHGDVLQALQRHRLYRDLQQHHLARRTLDWDRMPPALHHAAPPDHPFAADLDLIGPRSLHRLLDTTVSAGGSERLKRWLLAETPDLDAARQRQALVTELRPLKRFRDRLWLASSLAAVGKHQIEKHRRAVKRWDGEGVVKWLEGHTFDGSLRVWVALLSLVGPLNVTFFVLWVLGQMGTWWLLTTAIYGLTYALTRPRWANLFQEAAALETALSKFEAVARVLESHALPNAPGVARLLSPFRAVEKKPSQRMRGVAWLAGAAGISQKNEFFGTVLNLLVPWDLFWSDRLHAIKHQLRTDLPVWLDVWYEFEALGSLANYGWLHPARPFARFAHQPPPLYHAEALGHPLLPDDQKVRNDFEAARTGDVLLITGSNMSGKSTFLRTLGINAVLAQAGAPVDADALTLAPMRLFTSLNVVDSVHEGISFFYAEVRRLRALLDALGDAGPPVFFLIDEIFRGTNNRERLIGSRSFIRSLIGADGAGAIATHDLELTALEEEGEGVRNAHFRETVEGGEMVFDYRLHPGPCPTTNALRIMELAGLPVERVPEK